MTLQKLAAEIAKREGKRSQAKIYDIKESISILLDMLGEEFASEPIESGPLEQFILQQAYKRSDKILKKQKAKK